MTVKSRAPMPLQAGCELIPLAIKGDERGRLIAIEGLRDIPFAIERVYTVYATRPGVARGFHAHRSLRQAAVAVSGACTMVLDDGAGRMEVRLDRPEMALLIAPMVWHEMHDFSDDCVLMVLADAHYDEADYLRDYQAFLSALAR